MDLENMLGRNSNFLFTSLSYIGRWCRAIRRIPERVKILAIRKKKNLAPKLREDYELLGGRRPSQKRKDMN